MKNIFSMEMAHLQWHFDLKQKKKGKNDFLSLGKKRNCTSESALK